MNIHFGSWIGAIIDTVVHVEVDSSSGNDYGKFLGLLIEVNLYKPLARGTMLSILGSKVFISFQYERLPHL